MPSASAQRQIMLSAAVMFGVFGIAAFIFRRAGVYDDAVPVMAGIAAWTFLVLVVIVVLRDRLIGTDPRKEYHHFLSHHPDVIQRVGLPMRFRDDQGDVARGAGPAQLNLDVAVEGPDGSAQAELSMARLGRRWEVLSAALVAADQRVVLRGDRSAD